MPRLKFLLLLLVSLLSLVALAYYFGFEGGQGLGSSAEGPSKAFW
jgi:uncharacterized protein (UPF0333 family)